MTANVVEAPYEFDEFGPSVFLAGGISNTRDWQAELIELLRDTPVTLLNPRRKNYPWHEPAAAAAQIEWEFRHLRRATAVLFWFPPETLCPIALFELGSRVMVPGQPLFVGTDPGYARKLDVEIQLRLARPEVRVVTSVAELARQVLAWVAARPPQPEVRMEPISIPVGGGTLSGWYRPGEHDRNFALVWVHGFGSFRGGEKAAALRQHSDDMGWAFAAFDFRGHGKSSGGMHELRATRLLEDLGAVRDFLATRGHTCIGLVGSSMGGFASAWFAARNPESVVGCVLLAPAFGFLTRRWERLTDQEREEWRRTDRLRVKNDWVETELGYGLVEERDQFQPADLASGWKTPALIFHGMADDVVPPEDSLDFSRRTTYPDVELRLLKDGDHRLTAYKDDIANEACVFLARRLGEFEDRS